MRTLTRYVLKDLLFTCAFTALAITFVFFIGTTFRFLYEGTSYAQLLRVLPFAIPYTLPFTIPISLLIGTTLVYGRLVADLEVTAIRAAGVSVVRLFTPAFGLGLVASVLVLYLQSDFIPYCRYKKKDLQKEFIEKVLAPLDREDVRIVFPGFDLYMREKRGFDVRGVELQYHDVDPPVVVSAQRGTINVDVERNLLLIGLKDVVLTMAEFGDDEVRAVSRASFSTYTVDFPLVRRNRDRIQYMSNAALEQKRLEAVGEITKLKREIAESAAQGLPPPPTQQDRLFPGHVSALGTGAGGGAAWWAVRAPTDPRQLLVDQYEDILRKIRIEVGWRFSIALASLVFVLVGAPLPIVLAHPVRLVPFFAGSMIVGALYFGPLLIGKGMEDDSEWAAVIFWTIGCAVTALAGLYLTLRAARK